MSKRMVSLHELNEILHLAQGRLAREGRDISSVLPVGDLDDTASYGRLYLHAEQICLRKVRQALTNLPPIALPFDAEAEIEMPNVRRFAGWIRRRAAPQPTAVDFGNDLVHAVSRAALVFGLEDLRTARLALRVARLFADITCLVGAIYGLALLKEAGGQEIPLTDPNQLLQTLKEIDDFFQKQAPRVIVPAREQSFLKPESGPKPSHLSLVPAEGATSEV